MKRSDKTNRQKFASVAIFPRERIPQFFLTSDWQRVEMYQRMKRRQAKAVKKR